MIQNTYQDLLGQITVRYEQGKAQAMQTVNTNLVETYWHIGQYIVEYEQGGNSKAAYGEGLLKQLSKDLSLTYGKGFSLSNMYLMRLCYQRYPIFQTLSGKLGWSILSEILTIDDPLERSFYEKQAEIERWNVQELKRQKASSLFLQLAASKDKEGILQLAKQGQMLENQATLSRLF